MWIVGNFEVPEVVNICEEGSEHSCVLSGTSSLPQGSPQNPRVVGVRVGPSWERRDSLSC